MIKLLNISDILTKYHMKLMDELLFEYDSGYIKSEFSTITINFNIIEIISRITNHDLKREIE